ncbi:MAG: hypothetical protein IT488_11520 [Gammaproteobacteria bacterium]|nr:hypothetical protein [Gammaproteobacteria bacterium]
MMMIRVTDLRRCINVAPSASRLRIFSGRQFATIPQLADLPPDVQRIAALLRQGEEGELLARYDAEATWLDDLKPAQGAEHFFFEPEHEHWRNWQESRAG